MATRLAEPFVGRRSQPAVAPRAFPCVRRFHTDDSRPGQSLYLANRVSLPFSFFYKCLIRAFQARLDAASTASPTENAPITRGAPSDRTSAPASRLPTGMPPRNATP
jgi:hypothetical protein